MDMTIIGTKWVYRNKLDENGVVTRNKASLVAQGYNQHEEIDYDETYAPVARLESIRILLAYACALDFKLYQMDVKSAFLNGFINKEVYVAQPLGFIGFAKPNYVYRLKKALYGLKQAPKAWYDRLKVFLIKHNYSMGMVDNTLFTKKKDSNLIIVQIYVDDIIFGSTCQEMCDDFAKIMHDEFEMSTTHLGLWYLKGSGIETIVYPDSDHAGDYVDRKSTSGVCTFMGFCLTSWFSKNQTALAISTTEAEYVSAGKACQQALWMKQALVDYGVRLDDIPIMCDNKWAIDLSKNLVQYSRTKHIEIRHHFLRDTIQKGNISIEKVSSEDNIAVFHRIDTTYETEYDVQSSEDAGTDDDDDDDDVDEYFLVDEENEIVEPDLDVHLFGISMDLPFDNIGVTNLVPNDVLEGEDVDVINADGFDSDPGNDEEKNYTKRRLAELRTEIEGVINASGQWKRNLKLYKNDGVRIRARCDGKVPEFTMSQGTGPTGLNCGMEVEPSGSNALDKGILYPGSFRVNPDIPVKAVQDQLQRELEVQISMSKAFRAKAKAEREIRGDHCLGDDINLHPNSNITFISDRQKGIIPALKTVYPSRAKSNLLLNNICEVFNEGVIDKCTSPLTHTATRIMESIKKEAHLMKELTGIPCKHVVAACWNMALNDRATTPLETWVNPCYWLSTWKETYSHQIQPICRTKYWEKSTCPTTLLPPKHHVQVGGQGKRQRRGGNNVEANGLSAAAGEGGACGPGVAS
ncbi:copia protein [Tanacetum coccineum]